MSDRMFASFFLVGLVYAWPILLGFMGLALYAGFPWTLALIPLFTMILVGLGAGTRTVVMTFKTNDILWNRRRGY